MKLNRFPKNQKGFIVLLLDFLFVAAGIALLIHSLFKNERMIKTLFGR